MKKIGRSLSFISLSFLLIVTGCGNNSEQVGESTTNQTREFTDSAGRVIEVPKKITKIAPSGSLAQLVLYTSSPDLLVGLASPFSNEAKDFIDSKYLELPEFGQFYGKSANLNMEALSAAKPDVVIDVGEVKKTVKEDMDKLQEQLAIPTIFIEANLENMSETYERLGELLGNTDETDKLAAYCKKVIDQAADARAAIEEPEKKSVYYASGTAGLNTNAEGSFHAQVIDTVGAKNAVTGLEVVSKGSGTVVSLEQLMQWQPDYIITESQELYDLIRQEDSWKELTAVKEGKVYKVPTAPYNFMGFPPSVNRIIGIQWLGNLIYPENYELDIKKEVSEFYDLFYHNQPTEKQLSEILENAER